VPALPAGLANGDLVGRNRKGGWSAGAAGPQPVAEAVERVERVSEPVRDCS